jgi:hypothetical protein
MLTGLVLGCVRTRACLRGVCTALSSDRLAGTRGAQLRQICSDLKKICQHPFLLPEFEPEGRPEHGSAAAGAGGAAGDGSDAEYLAALVSGSAKMQVLDKMLQQLRGEGKQVLVMAHTPKVRGHDGALRLVCTGCAPAAVKLVAS